MPCRLYTRAGRIWKASQVELQGLYSIERLYRVHAFCAQSSVFLSFCVLILTPIPCFAVSILVECIPLQKPALGADAASLFWLRAFLVTFICDFLALLPCRYLIPSLPASAVHMLVTASFAALVTVATDYVVARSVGFPVPFTLLLGSPVDAVVLVVGGWIMWGRYFLHNNDKRRDLIDYVLVISTQLVMIYVYPAYAFVFVRLSSRQQLLFAILLPGIKLLVKNWISYLFRDKHDLKSDMVVLNADVYHSIFVSWCMNGRSSIYSTSLLMAMDILEGLIALHDIGRMFRCLIPILERAGVDQSHRLFCSRHCLAGRRVASMSENQNDVPLLDLAVALWEIDKNTPNVSVRAESHVQSPTRWRVSGVSPAYETKVTSPSTSLHPLLYSSRSPSPSVTQAPFSAPHTWSRMQMFPYLRTLHGHLRVPQKSAQLAVMRMSKEDRQQCLEISLRLFHLSEFLLLIEFTEVIIPCVYCLYLAGVYYLPNRVFFETIRDLDDSDLRSDIANVAFYALLEMASLMVLMFVLQRKLGFAPVKLLAFVLESQWQLAQSKLVLWVIFAVQSRLEHFGADYSFQFKWLR